MRIIIISCLFSWFLFLNADFAQINSELSKIEDSLKKQNSNLELQPKLSILKSNLNYLTDNLKIANGEEPSACTSCRLETSSSVVPKVSPAVMPKTGIVPPPLSPPGAGSQKGSTVSNTAPQPPAMPKSGIVPQAPPPPPSGKASTGSKVGTPPPPPPPPGKGLPASIVGAKTDVTPSKAVTPKSPTAAGSESDMMKELREAQEKQERRKALQGSNKVEVVPKKSQEQDFTVSVADLKRPLRKTPAGTKTETAPEQKAVVVPKSEVKTEPSVKQPVATSQTQPTVAPLTDEDVADIKVALVDTGLKPIQAGQLANRFKGQRLLKGDIIKRINEHKNESDKTKVVSTLNKEFLN
ncbi:MAG: hypothetical protein UR26_C0006G0041 [candidate division TM6 bacterium GW2011_GWF2_32_72]|nr:MAG: hypothetical protein UR26_C0006G0041 [candidate division TM6 bacterium GW2011_GWF2_32_72]